MCFAKYFFLLILCPNSPSYTRISPRDYVASFSFLALLTETTLEADENATAVRWVFPARWHTFNLDNTVPVKFRRCTSGSMVRGNNIWVNPLPLLLLLEVLVLAQLTPATAAGNSTEVGVGADASPCDGDSSAIEDDVCNVENNNEACGKRPPSMPQNCRYSQQAKCVGVAPVDVYSGFYELAKCMIHNSNGALQCWAENEMCYMILGCGNCTSIRSNGGDAGPPRLTKNFVPTTKQRLGWTTK